MGVCCSSAQISVLSEEAEKATLIASQNAHEKGIQDAQDAQECIDELKQRDQSYYDGLTMLCSKENDELRSSLGVLIHPIRGPGQVDVDGQTQQQRSLLCKIPGSELKYGLNNQVQVQAHVQTQTQIVKKNKTTNVNNDSDSYAEDIIIIDMNSKANELGSRKTVIKAYERITIDKRGELYFNTLSYYYNTVGAQ